MCAAPKGNKFALGNEGGRPPIYDDPKKLYEKCEQYFDSLIGTKERPTITGLTIFLGFDSRSTLYEYAKKDEFSHIIKRAMLVVEHEYEIATREDRSATGSIFVLKNMGWKDTQEIDHTTKGDKIQNNSLDLTKLSDAALREIANAARPEGGKD